MQKWEYLTVKQKRKLSVGILGSDLSSWEPDISLNDLGNEGWELVSTIPCNSLPIEAGLTSEVVWVFKRPIE